MKILESQPRRYDRGIALLSLGRFEKVKERLVAENVRPGDRVLDIGCGTGTAAVLAARAGARVTGFDVSAPMLAVAREKIESFGLGNSIELIEMGISGMDGFADRSFDVVMSTLVFSELSPDERSYALNHASRILTPGGRLVVADEVRPETFGRRLAYDLVRIPLLALTFALTQTTTRPVEGLPGLIRQAGFRIEREERTALGSFLSLAAVKENRT
ncbi:MAG: corrinoid protein-associated methyltransferase CpaM [Candidatus Glassbacteria bacterium]